MIPEGPLPQQRTPQKDLENPKRSAQKRQALSLSAVEKIPQIISQHPLAGASGSKKSPQLSKEQILCDKLDYLISGFNFVIKHAKKLDIVTHSRGLDLFLKISRQEFRDYETSKKKKQGLKKDKKDSAGGAQDESLLKKRDQTFLNVERTLDVIKLIKADYREMKIEESKLDIPQIVAYMGNSQQRLEKIIEVSKMRAKFLRKKIKNKVKLKAQEDREEAARTSRASDSVSHSDNDSRMVEERGLDEEVGETFEEDLEVLLDHHMAIVECITASRVDMSTKLRLAYDYLILVYDEEGYESRSFRPLMEKVFERIEQHDEEMDETDIDVWEREFILRLPDSSSALVNHVYRMSKLYKSITILPQIAEFLPDDIKEEAIKKIMKLGSKKILQKAENIFSKTIFFDKVMVPESVRLFTKLKENSEKYESAPLEKIKKLIFPLFMCLLKKTELFIELIKDYHKLASPAKTFIIGKFTTILKSILKSKEIGGLYFEALLIQRDESGFPEDYQELINAFKTYVKIQGDKTQEIFSDSIAKYVIQSGKLSILGEFAEDMNKEKVVKVLLDLHNKPDFDLARLEEVYQTAKMSKHELLVEVIFYSVQNDITLPSLTSIQRLLMEQIKLADYAKPMFRQKLLLRLNKILPNAQRVNKEIKPVPDLFFPFLLKVIFLLHAKLGIPKPWEIFIELVKLLIKARKQKEKVVWQGLLRYAKFDRMLTETKIAPLLPLDDKEKLFNEAF